LPKKGQVARVEIGEMAQGEEAGQSEVRELALEARYRVEKSRLWRASWRVDRGRSTISEWPNCHGRDSDPWFAGKNSCGNTVRTDRCYGGKLVGKGIKKKQVEKCRKSYIKVVWTCSTTILTFASYKIWKDKIGFVSEKNGCASRAREYFPHISNYFDQYLSPLPFC
jgi:hypothetical protein